MLKYSIVTIFVVIFVPVVYAFGDPIVATVNGKKILQSDIVQAQSLLPQQYKGEAIEVIFPGLLNSLIDSYLAANYARGRGMDKGEDFLRDLARIKRQVLQRLVLKKVIAEAVTEEAVKARFKELKLKMVNKEEVHARHILLKTEEKALKVILELDKGADFIKLAKKESIGPSKVSGGDLGFFGRGQMVPEFEKAAFKLEQGVYTSMPVKSKFGWHIILNEGRRKGLQATFDEAKDQIRNQMTQEVVTTMLSDLRKDAKIEKFNFDGTSKK